METVVVMRGMFRVARMKWYFLFIAAFCALFIVASSNANAVDARKVQLYATDGYYTLADGKQVYIWGYSLENKPGTAVFPGPKIETEEGDIVEVTVTNIGPQKNGADFQVRPLRVKVLDDQSADDRILSVGQSDTRLITASQAGSYYYYSYDANQYGIQMGLNGPFVVKAKSSAKQAWTGGPNYDKEYVFHINEVDPEWHQTAEVGNLYDYGKFHPRYWTINGKSFPDLESDPSTMIHGKVGEKIMVRLINPGRDEHPMHLHGHHFQVIAENGVPLPIPVDKDTVNLDPGETKDILVTFDQSGHFPFHSHKIVDNTNNGVYPGGLHTMTHIEQAGNTGEATITLKVGETHAIVNGEHVMLDVAPFQLKGDTYVPFQFIADEFGGTLQTNAKDRNYIYKTENSEFQLWLIQKLGIMNGQQIQLQSPILQVKGKVMVPLSVISTYLCSTVDMDHSSDAITIQYQTGQECHTPDRDRTAPVVRAAPAGGTYSSTQNVTLTIQDDDPNAVIYYTLGGSAPTKSSARYTSPIPISQNTILKFIGIDTSGNASDVQTESYIIESASEVLVEVMNDRFSSAQIKVKKGTKVTWVLKSTMMHTVTSYEGIFDGVVTPNGNTRFSYTFNETGTFNYFCMVHPFMTGTVIVE